MQKKNMEKLSKEILKEFDKKFPQWGGGLEVSGENKIIIGFKNFLFSALDRQLEEVIKIVEKLDEDITKTKGHALLDLLTKFQTKN